MSSITDSACGSSPVRCYNDQNPVTEQLLPLIWQHTTSASTFWQNEHIGIYGMSNTQPFPDNWLSHKTSSFLLADKRPFHRYWCQTVAANAEQCTHHHHAASLSKIRSPIWKASKSTPHFSVAVWYECQPLPPPVPSCAVSCPFNVSLCGHRLVPFPKVPAPPGGATSTGSQHSLTAASWSCPCSCGWCRGDWPVRQHNGFSNRMVNMNLSRNESVLSSRTILCLCI